MNSTCPPDDRLVQALDPTVEDPGLHAHIAGCIRCCARLERLERKDTLMPGVVWKSSREGPPDAQGSSLQDFEILREIRRGGQGVVYEARDRQSSRRVALKVTHSASEASRQVSGRFEREITLTAGLDHPGIVRLYQSGRAADGTLFFAMEYIEGEDLGELVEREGPARSDQDIERRLELFARLCDAVAHAHQRGVIHRDLKPSNVRIDGTGAPHILDFGLAKQVDIEASDEMTRSVEFLGTVVWAAPEQTPLVDHEVGAWTDVHALGLLLHYMLTAQHAFPTEGSMLELFKRVAHAKPSLPSSHLPRYRDRRDLDAIVRKALEKDPQDRYPSVRALLEDCRRLRAGLPVTAADSGVVLLARKYARRHPLTMGAIVVGLILLGLTEMGRRREVRARDRLDAYVSLSEISGWPESGLEATTDEETLWRIALSGTPGVAKRAGSSRAFPGGPVVHDKLRSVYESMPAYKSLRVPVPVPYFPGPTTQHVSWVSVGEDIEQSRLTLCKLPTLELECIDLPLDRVTNWRLDEREEVLYLLSQGESPGVYALDWETRRVAQPRLLSPSEAASAPFRRLPFKNPSGEPFVYLVPRHFFESGGVELLASRLPDLASFVIWTERQFLVSSRDGRQENYYQGPNGWVPSGLESVYGSLIEWDGSQKPVGIPQADCVVPKDAFYELDSLTREERFSPPGAFVRGQSIGEDRDFILVKTGSNNTLRARWHPARKDDVPRDLCGHSSPIERVHLTPDLQFAITMEANGLLRCWDMRQVIHGPVERLNTIGKRFCIHSIVESESFLALSGAEGANHETKGRLTVVDKKSRQYREVALDGRRSGTIGFLPGSDGVLLLTCDGQPLSTVDLHDANSKPVPLPRPNLQGSPGRFVYTEFDVDHPSLQVALPTREGALHLLEFEVGQLEPIQDRVIHLFADESNSSAASLKEACWSPGGEWLAVASTRGTIHWLRDGQLLEQRGVHHLHNVRALAASPDGKWLAAGSDDQSVSIWQWGAGKPSVLLEGGQTTPIFALEFDSTGRRLASAGANGMIQVWDLETWSDHGPVELHRFLTGDKIVLSLLFSEGPRGEVLHIGGDDFGGLGIWDPAKLDPYVARHVEYWISEIGDAADPDQVARMRAWSEVVLSEL